MTDCTIDPLAEMFGEECAETTLTAPVRPAAKSRSNLERPTASTASTDELADLLGISARAVTEMERRGVITKHAVGIWPVRESVRRYCEHIREQAAGRTGSSTLTAERIRVAKEQAEKLTMANAATRGEMVPARQVQHEWASILRDVRAALMAVASRCGATLPHLTAHDVATVDGEIRNALEALADGN